MYVSDYEVALCKNNTCNHVFYIFIHVSLCVKFAGLLHFFKVENMSHCIMYNIKSID